MRDSRTYIPLLFIIDKKKKLFLLPLQIALVFLQCYCAIFKLISHAFHILLSQVLPR